MQNPIYKWMTKFGVPHDKTESSTFMIVWKELSMEKQWGFNQQKWEDPYIRGLLKQNVLVYYETYKIIIP